MTKKHGIKINGDNQTILVIYSVVLMNYIFLLYVFENTLNLLASFRFSNFNLSLFNFFRLHFNKGLRN